MLRTFLIASLIALLTACTAAPAATLPTATQAPLPAAPESPQPTVTVAPLPTVVEAVRMTATAAESPTPLATATSPAGQSVLNPSEVTAADATPSPMTAKVYANELWGLSFPYPAEWVEVQGSEQNLVQYSGADGFFELRGPFSGDSCDMLRACYLDAEEPQRDCWAHGAGVMGTFPHFYIPLPGPMPGREAWVTLQTDPAHIEQIINEVQIDPQARADIWKTPAPIWYDWVAEEYKDLTINEFFLDSITDSGSSGLCSMTYDGTVPEDDLFIHEEQRNAPSWDPGDITEITIAQLPLFGYQLEGPVDGLYTLKQGDVVVKDQIKRIVAYSESARQRHFVLVVETDPSTLWLVRENSVEEHFPGPDPVFAGQRLITVQVEPAAIGEGIVVKQDGVEVFSFLNKDQLISSAYLNHLDMQSPPVINLQSYGEHWALEVAGTLIVDGQVWNETLPADEIYGFRLFYGKPFFFFLRAGTTGIWYDGEELPVQYDVIAHDHLEQPGPNSPHSNDQMVWFFARRDSAWFYIEILVEPY